MAVIRSIDVHHSLSLLLWWGEDLWKVTRQRNLDAGRNTKLAIIRRYGVEQRNFAVIYPPVLLEFMMQARWRPILLKS